MIYMKISISNSLTFYKAFDNMPYFFNLGYQKEIIHLSTKFQRSYNPIINCIDAFQ